MDPRNDLPGPINTNLVIQSSDMGLMHLASLADTGALDLSPKFQRRNRWDQTRQSRLIESFLINAPVPEIYLAEERDGSFSVIDGKQRLTAITEFLSDNYRLRDLTFIQHLNGATFSSLTLADQNALRMRPLRVVVILKATQEWLKYEVFMRLNTGGQPLNRQEVRNVAFPGLLNDRIIDLAEDPFLRSQLKIQGRHSNAYMDMSDVEYVLRFLTLSTTFPSFSGDLAHSMDRFMLENQWCSPSQVEDFAQRFRRAIQICEKIWGEHAFQRWDPKLHQWRNQMIGGMFDAQMLATDQLNTTQIRRALENGGRIREETRKLFWNPNFESAVRVQTNTPSKLHLRVELIRDMLLGA